MGCSICNSPQRAAIEKELLEGAYGDSAATFKGVAKKYKLDIKDVQIHALSHMVPETNDTIVNTIKKKEAYRLQGLLDENFNVLQEAGTAIKAMLAANTAENCTIGALTKPLVELYLGCGVGIRDTVLSIAKLNTLINGPKDDAGSALNKLVEVIQNSKADND